MADVIALFTRRDDIIAYLSRRIGHLVAEIAADYDVDREFARRFRDSFRNELYDVVPDHVTLADAEVVFKQFQPYWRMGIIRGLDNCAERKRR